MKAYIAAPYPERDVAIIVMQQLEAGGIEVTSTWLRRLDQLTNSDARKDLVDVERADVLVALNPHGWEKKGTGGRHVEFGYALALGKPIVLVGKRSNIFHYLDIVTVVADTENLAAHLALAFVGEG